MTHLWHVAQSVGALVVVVAWVAIAERSSLRRREPRAHPAPTPRGIALGIVAAAGVGSAAVHIAVIPEHFGEAFLYGAFFTTTAAAQLGYSGWLVRRPSRRLVAAGVAANLALLALWLGTRLIAVPFGPDAGSREDFGRLDLLASGFELAAVVAGLVLLTSGRRRPAADYEVTGTLTSLPPSNVSR